MDTRITTKAPHGKERLIEIESLSRPGLVHFVSLRTSSCSCKATVKVCRHVRIARIRAAKSTRVCRVCGGYGAHLWGESKVADCSWCNGTGRAA